MDRSSVRTEEASSRSVSVLGLCLGNLSDLWSFQSCTYKFSLETPVIRQHGVRGRQKAIESSRLGDNSLLLCGLYSSWTVGMYGERK